jgi:hypothetical protein
MTEEVKWIGWAESPRTLITSARELIGPHVQERLKEYWRELCCFTFHDGTTQGWTLDQLYETSSQNKLTPFTHPTTGQFFGFTLENSGGLALAASASPLVIAQQAVTQCDIYLVSPDVSLRPCWQNIAGYSLDLYRTITTACGEPPGPMFFAQLQLYVTDSTDNSLRLFAEWDTVKNTYLFHPIQLLTPYPFTWKPPFLTDPKYKVRQVRVRFTMPYPTAPGAGECMLPSGKWLIGNVCPELK